MSDKGDKPDWLRIRGSAEHHFFVPSGRYVTIFEVWASYCGPDHKQILSRLTKRPRRTMNIKSKAVTEGEPVYCPSCIRALEYSINPDNWNHQE